jgi:hypothetical protein
MRCKPLALVMACVPGLDACIQIDPRPSYVMWRKVATTNMCLSILTSIASRALVVGD